MAPLHAAVALADRLAGRARRDPLPRAHEATGVGISVVIPDRDAPELLMRALDSVRSALEGLTEPSQVVVTTNGAPSERYAEVARAHPHTEFVHHAEPLGFGAAVVAGLKRVRHDWTLLLNNDMTLERDALHELAACRAGDVFAIGAQIIQRSADGRREETGFTDWYADASGVRIFHAPPGDGGVPRRTLCVSGGAGLFQTRQLRRYAGDSVCYDPFYWEDVEWSVRAQREGFRVLFCARAIAHHLHRATTSRFYTPTEIERVVERNRVLCDLRNAITGHGAASLLQRVCDLPYASQRELSRLSVAARVFARRRRAACVQLPVVPVTLPVAGGPPSRVTPTFSVRFRSAARPRLLVISPYCIYPARHGGARRVEGLLRRLRCEFDVALVSDEASLHDARSFASFDGLLGVHLVQRAVGDDAAAGADLADRMRSHGHHALRQAVIDALRIHRPDVVQVEHVELAMLSKLRQAGQRWILGLHDAFSPSDFRDPAEGARFADHVRSTYDAVTVCSREDHRLFAHPRAVCVFNGTDSTQMEHAPSDSAQLLFMGPFRYVQNLNGIRHFLRVAYPAIKDAVPEASLVVLGGDGAPAATAGDDVFAQPGVRVLEHREDIAALLGASAMTVNPLSGIRGSAIKVIESLAAGRVCVSTLEGARGYADAGLPGLVAVSDVAGMIDPIVKLLTDPARRRDIERPDAAQLARFSWQQCAAVQGDLYRSLLGTSDA
ncbi:MAG: glycosyltransferase [Betaproteobacteria bacterium]